MYKRLLMIALIAVVAIAGIYLSALEGEQQEGQLIRFHVLANSDSPEDQLLKEKVRDAIIPEMSKLLSAADEIDESRRIIQNNLVTIEKLASDEIERNGESYPVEVILDRHIFPTRKYGNLVLAAGEYEALRVIIGDGKGQNWWCVMFPPLCFVDIKSGLIDEKTQLELKSVLSTEEYEAAFADGVVTELPLQLKLKVWEWVKSSKDQIFRFASKY